MTEPDQAETATEPAGDLALQLTRIARVLLTPGTLDETLERIVTLAVRTIEGCDEAGLCAQTPDDDTAVQTSPRLTELDRLQTSLREGPCYDALDGKDAVHAADLLQEQRWPLFCPQAVAAGMRSVLAYRLLAGGETAGALHLYSALPGAFSAKDRTLGLIFAAHAGMAMEVAHAQAAERLRFDDLQVALGSREVIGQAQGILMERERITAQQAFDLLRRASQHLNVKLRDVAQELVDTGAVPVSEPTRT